MPSADGRQWSSPSATTVRDLVDDWSGSDPARPCGWCPLDLPASSVRCWRRRVSTINGIRRRSGPLLGLHFINRTVFQWPSRWRNISGRASGADSVVRVRCAPGAGAEAARVMVLGNRLPAACAARARRLACGVHRVHHHGRIVCCECLLCCEIWAASATFGSSCGLAAFGLLCSNCSDILGERALRSGQLDEKKLRFVRPATRLGPVSHS